MHAPKGFRASQDHDHMAIGEEKHTPRRRVPLPLLLGAAVVLLVLLAAVVVAVMHHSHVSAQFRTALESARQDSSVYTENLLKGLLREYPRAPEAPAARRALQRIEAHRGEIAAAVDDGLVRARARADVGDLEGALQVLDSVLTTYGSSPEAAPLRKLRVETEFRAAQARLARPEPVVPAPPPPAGPPRPATVVEIAPVPSTPPQVASVSETPLVATPAPPPARTAEPQPEPVIPPPVAAIDPAEEPPPAPVAAPWRPMELTVTRPYAARETAPTPVEHRSVVGRFKLKREAMLERNKRIKSQDPTAARDTIYELSYDRATRMWELIAVQVR